MVSGRVLARHGRSEQEVACSHPVVAVTYVAPWSAAEDMGTRPLAVCACPALPCPARRWSWLCGGGVWRTASPSGWSFWLSVTWTPRFVGAVQDVQPQGAAGRAERAGQVVEGADGPAGGGQDQVAGGQAAGVVAGLSSATSRMSRPSASGRPTARRSRARRPAIRDASCGGRTDSPRASLASTWCGKRLVGGDGQVEALAEAIGPRARRDQDRTVTLVLSASPRRGV